MTSTSDVTSSTKKEENGNITSDRTSDDSDTTIEDNEKVYMRIR